MKRNAALRVVSTIALVGAIIHASPSHAQIVHDTSLGGPRTDLGKGPSFFIDAALGKVRGKNLFYSFEQFNVLQNQTATFGGPTGATISNVVSRVTGGSSSQIFGTIALAQQIHGANFFLLNPNGVIVGPGASFDVGGSVHLTTADYLRFTDGTQVFARPVAGEVLSVSAPAAFGFLGTSSTASSIDIRGVMLKAAEQQTLSVIGGEVAISGATLAAPGGRVQIASLSSGEMMLDGSVTPSSRLGPITITGSLIGATGFDDNGIGLGSGTVIIRGGQLLVDASTIVAHTWEDVAGPRLIDIQVTGDVVLTNGAKISSTTFVADRGGDVTITADRLRLENQSLVETNAFAEGDGGDVTATVGRLAVVGGSIIRSTTDFATGHGGNITVKADAITISGRDSANNPSGIFSDALADGDGGKVSIVPRSSTLDLVLDDVGTIGSRTLFGAGGGGGIEVNATSVSLLGGATISSLTSTLAPGGGIALTADSVTISGGDSSNPGARSGIFSGSLGAGDTDRPGKISVTATNFTLTQGGVIQSGFILAPQAGDIEVTATNSLVISNGGSISSQAFARPGGQVSLVAGTAIMDRGFVNTSTIGAGPAGNVFFDVATLTMVNGAQVASSSAENSPGPGGSVTVRARDSVAISGRGASINSFTNDASTGLFSTTASPDPQGSAGKVVVTAPTLTIADRGKISVESTGVASAGDISLTLGNLTLAGGGGLFSNATSSGPGGNINVQAGQVQLSSGATISAKSSGTGLAGSVTIRAGTLQSQDSFITTQATQADGGDIDILVGSLVHLSGSEIITSVQSGAGKGGNITIDPQFVVLNNSQIRADASGGPGGNITIVTDVFLSSGSIVSASSALSAPGTIDIQAQTSEVSGTLALLPEGMLQAAALLRASCELRTAGGSASSLIVAGRDGVPLDPGGPLPAAGLLGQAWLMSAQEAPQARTALAPTIARVSEAMSARIDALLPCTR